uniref:Uncharacterized protein n=1 Tax=Arundo donax TaxID=35708 RepID=A0A0A8Z7V3_ARUDO
MSVMSSVTRVCLKGAWWQWQQQKHISLF